VLLDGEAGADDLELAARITARFSKGRDAAQVIIKAAGTNGAVRQFAVSPLPAEQILPEWYL
jgi:tRNA-specific 2-thiouridylase